MTRYPTPVGASESAAACYSHTGMKSRAKWLLMSPSVNGHIIHGAVDEKKMRYFDRLHTAVDNTQVWYGYCSFQLLNTMQKSSKTILGLSNAT